MIFNTHLNQAGRHATFGASKYAWVDYDDDKMERVFLAAQEAKRGVDLHALAHEAIRLRVKQEENTTLGLYVNDGIGFKMTCEQTLFFSDDFYGTADTISFRNEKLRISDLKNGVTPVKVTQLKIYAGLFCLEYGVKPFDIDMEFRIYQNNEVELYEGDADEIFHIMDRIITGNKLLKEIRKELE